MKIYLKIIAILVISGAFAFTACSDDSGSSDGAVTASDTAVTISAIPGVVVPVIGATPVTTAIDTAEYTGTVAWSGSPVTFAGSTVYTATITLTAKSGYTLTGVTANFFTVAGVTSDSNSIKF